MYAVIGVLVVFSYTVWTWSSILVRENRHKTWSRDWYYISVIL